LGGIETLTGTAEDIRRKRRQEEIVEAILEGKDIPKRKEPERAKSTLGKIMQVIGAPFDPRRAPMGRVPIEETIAEAMVKEKISPTPWKPTTKAGAEEFERVKGEAAGKLEELRFKHELTMEKENRKHQNRMEIIALEQRRDTAKTEAQTRKINEQIKKLQREGKQMDIDIEGEEEAIKKMRGGGYSVEDIFNRLWRKGVDKAGLGPEEVGVQETLPGIEEPPAEALIPNWLPPDVQERLRALKKAGATDEEIQEVINSYRR